MTGDRRFRTQAGVGLLLLTTALPAAGDNLIDPTNILWKPYPLRNIWQNDRHLQGGEGKQLKMDLDWNLHDTKVLYVLTDTCRIWKSLDRGNNWFPVARDMRWEGGSCIVSDPFNSNVVYVAAHKNGNWSGVTNEYDGLYRSLDGGETWSRTPGGFVRFIKCEGGKFILIDPSSYDGGLGRCATIYAGWPEGLIASTNGGDSWQANTNFDGHQVVDLEFSVADPRHVYVASHLGLFKMDTLDGSRSVVNTNLPLPHMLLQTNSTQWDIDLPPYTVNGQDMLHAALTNGYYQSTNGGATFARCTNGLPGGREFGRVVVSQSNPDRLFLSPGWWGNIGVHYPGPFFSHDGGMTWTSPIAETAYVTSQETSEFLDRSWTFTTRPVAFDPDDADIAMTFFFHCPGKTFDGGPMWHFSGNGMLGGRPKEVQFLSSNKMMFVIEDFGWGWSTNAGAVIQKKDPYTGSSIALRGTNLIAARYTTYDIYKTSFPTSQMPYNTGWIGGWVKKIDIGNGVNFIRFHPTNDNIVYVGASWQGGKVSFDGGNTWSNIKSVVSAMDPLNGDVLYGWESHFAYHLASFRLESNGLAATSLGYMIQAPNSRCQDMDVDPFSPTNARRLIAAIDQYGVSVYNGSTWTVRDNDDGFSLISNDFVKCVRYDPVHSNIVWAGVANWDGHGSGVYLSQDGGTTWTNVNNNLGKYLTVFNIDISPYDGTVFLGANGMYTFRIQDLLDGRPQQPLPLHDTDGDGIPDGWEVQYFGGITNAGAEVDDDGDGLNNLAEYMASTCPTNGDTDADDMPDGWEIEAFGDISQGPGRDPDGDSLSNREEFYWATNPRCATSRVDFAAHLDGGCALRWNSAEGRNYHLWFTDDELACTGLTWRGLAAHTNMPGIPGSMCRTDTVEAVKSRRYRLSVTIP